MKNVGIYFSEHTEIIKLVEVQRKNCLQILVKDHSTQILTIVTWDFNINMEVSVQQMVTSEDSHKHLVKGMNYKMNYFLQENDITDLEYNIPLRQFESQFTNNTISYRKQTEMVTQYNNQRKVHEDQARYLGVEMACVLFYPLSRMDIVIWHNISMSW